MNTFKINSKARPHLKVAEQFLKLAQTAEDADTFKSRIASVNAALSDAMKHQMPPIAPSGAGSTK